jgi:hypothetical protein
MFSNFGVDGLDQANNIIPSDSNNNGDSVYCHLDVFSPSSFDSSENEKHNVSYSSALFPSSELYSFSTLPPLHFFDNNPSSTEDSSIDNEFDTILNQLSVIQHSPFTDLKSLNVKTFYIKIYILFLFIIFFVKLEETILYHGFQAQKFLMRVC